MPENNKVGRPIKWFTSVRQIRVPDKYADKLVQLAFEWQQIENGESNEKA